MKEDDLPILDQLIGSLDSSVSKIEEFYLKKNSERFSQAKKFTSQLSKQISEMMD